MSEHMTFEIRERKRIIEGWNCPSNRCYVCKETFSEHVLLTPGEYDLFIKQGYRIQECSVDARLGTVFGVVTPPQPPEDPCDSDFMQEIST